MGNAKGKRFRWLRRAAWAIGAIALLLVIAATMFRWQNQAELARALAALEAKGWPTTKEDFASIYPVVPDERNVGPRITGAARASYEPLNALEQTLLSEADARGELNGPIPGVPIMGTAEDPPDTGWLPQATLNILRRYLDAAPDAVALARKATDVPEGQIQCGLDERGLPSNPALIDVRSVARLLRVQQIVALHDHDYDAFVELTRRQIALSRTLRGVPHNIAPIVRTVVEHDSVVEIERAFDLGVLDTEHLITLAKLLASIDYRDDLGAALLGDTLEATLLPPSGGLENPDFREVYIAKSVGEEAYEVLTPLSKRLLGAATGALGLVHRAKAEAITNAMTLTTALEGPWSGFENARRAVRHRLSAQPAWKAEPARSVFSFLDHSTDTVLNHLTGLQLLAARLAIAAYQLDHDGAPPPTLKDLVPQYLDRAPMDFFHDTPLYYRQDGGKGEFFLDRVMAGDVIPE